jgi:hypothetical protein
MTPISEKEKQHSSTIERKRKTKTNALDVSKHLSLEAPLEFQ